MATLAIEQNNAHLTVTSTTTANGTTSSSYLNANGTAKANANVNALCSKPIKIPLSQSERFSTQLSTGSADSACVVAASSSNNDVRTPNSSFVSLTAVAASRKTEDSITQRSASLSLHGAAHPKSQLQKLKQPAYRQLLSQDSGIDNDRDSAVGSQQQLKSAHCSSSSNESIGANSSGDLSHSKYSEDNLESEVSSGYSGSTHSFGALSSSVTRRIKYKSCNSSTTLGLGLEDRIDEVEDLHLDDDDDEDGVDGESPALGEAEEEDDPDDSGLQMCVSPNPETHQLEASTSLKPDPQNDTKKSSEKSKEDVESLKNKGQVLATDGNYYFPLLNISDDPLINPKLINKKDGLQDCMYYLDEFGSPRLREKYARKQKLKEMKQQKQKAKKKASDEAKAKENTVTKAQPATTTKKRHCTFTTQECQEAEELQPLHPPHPKAEIQAPPHHQHHLNNKSKNTLETHCDTKENSHVSYEVKKSADSCKIQTKDEVAVASEARADDEDLENANDDEGPCTEDPCNLRKSSMTPSCVSWTKVMKKFKNMLGKFIVQYI